MSIPKPTDCLIGKFKKTVPKDRTPKMVLILPPKK